MYVTKILVLPKYVRAINTSYGFNFRFKNSKVCLSFNENGNIYHTKYALNSPEFAPYQIDLAGESLEPGTFYQIYHQKPNIVA